jgi:hypothetical protein
MAVNLSSPELLLVIDVFLSLSWLTFEYINSEAVYGRRKTWNGFSVPHSVDVAFITCVHHLLWSASIAKKYRAQIHDAAVGEPHQFIKYLQDAFGGSLGREAYLLIVKERWDALEKRRVKYILGLLAKRPFIRIASESIRLGLRIMTWRARPTGGLLLADYCDSAESRELISAIQAKLAALHLFRGVVSSDSRMMVASRPGGVREFVAVKWLVFRGYCVALPDVQGVRKTLLNITPRVAIERRDSCFNGTVTTVKGSVRHILPQDLNGLVTTIVRNSTDNISFVETGNRFVKEKPLVVACEGPDGVGKSTIIKKLSAKCSEIGGSVIVRHWRPGLLPQLGALVGKSSPFDRGPVVPRRTPGHFHWLRLPYYLVDFSLGSLVKHFVDSGKRRLVLYDRCALDMAVDPVRYGLRSARGTLLLWKLIPKPNPVVLLYDTPERIVARKSDLKEEEIARQLEAWLGLAEQGHVNAVIRVDAEPEEIARRIQDLLADELIRMNGGDLGAKLRDQEAVGTLMAIVSAKPFPTFAVVPAKRRPRFLIPLGPRGAAAASLKIYNPQKPLARLTKHLLGIGLRTGLAQRFLPTNRTCSTRDPLPPDGLASRSLQEHLSDVLGEKSLSMAVSFGIPGPLRKPVLQLMNSRGKILGYAKVGWNEHTIELVRREEGVLARLRGVRFSTATIPRVVHAGWWDGRYILVEDAPAGLTKPSGHELSHRHLEFLRELRTVNPKQSRSVENGPANELTRRIAALRARGLHYYPHLLEQALARCVERLVDVPISFGFKHGDFTPWNILDESGKLFILDWEYAEESALPGWDLFHFIVQTSVLVRGLDPRRCLQAVRRQCTAPGGLAEFLTLAGATQQLLGPLFFLYVADVMSWGLLRNPEASHEKGHKLIAAWTYLLTMAAFADSPF